MTLCARLRTDVLSVYAVNACVMLAGVMLYAAHGVMSSMCFCVASGRDVTFCHHPRRQPLSDGARLRQLVRLFCLHACGCLLFEAVSRTCPPRFFYWWPLLIGTCSWTVEVPVGSIRWVAAVEVLLRSPVCVALRRISVALMCFAVAQNIRVADK